MKTHAGVIVGNVYDKYGTRNSLARRLVDGFLTAFDEMVDATGAVSALEAGCGEGELSLRLARRGIRTRAFDISPDLIAGATQRARETGLPVDFRVDDIYTFDVADCSEDLLVCCEVLEHLPRPEAAIERIAAAAGGFVVLSVPREPVWRCLNLLRLHYLGRLGNTPGHLQHWSKRGFVELVARHFTVVRVASPLPWTLVLARVNTSVRPTEGAALAG